MQDEGVEVGMKKIEEALAKIVKDYGYNAKFYVTQDGHAITEPMTAADIVAKFGAIRELEANGFRVVPA